MIVIQVVNKRIEQRKKRSIDKITMSQESKLCSLCVQESVECLVSQQNHPGLAESTADVDLVAVVEDLDGEKGSCNLWTG